MTKFRKVRGLNRSVLKLKCVHARLCKLPCLQLRMKDIEQVIQIPETHTDPFLHLLTSIQPCHSAPVFLGLVDVLHGVCGELCAAPGAGSGVCRRPGCLPAASRLPLRSPRAKSSFRGLLPSASSLPLPYSGWTQPVFGLKPFRSSQTIAGLLWGVR